uniref:Inhibitor of apoptosis n=1 Tax=Crassostrea virginica TaxID=6565 RepID=A0A8B8AHZ5_CRAVI|nr:putative inhibitor of apoptosis [Crassostrea virginica]
MSGNDRAPYSLPPAFQVPTAGALSDRTAVQVSEDDSCRSVSEYFSILNTSKLPRVSSDHDLETDSIPVTHTASETSLFDSDLEHDGEIQSPVASPSNLLQASSSVPMSSSSSSYKSHSTFSKDLLSSLPSYSQNRHPESALFSVAPTSLQESDYVSENTLFETPSNYESNFSQTNTQNGTPSLSFSECRYPQYADEQARLDSFRNWPSYLTQTGHQLTAAGFYYTSWNDWVRCFCCGIGVREWAPGDDPWAEHARWSPRCSFVRLMGKSQSSYDECSSRHESHESKRTSLVDTPLSFPTRIADNESDGIQSSPKPSELDAYPEKTLARNPLLTDAAQSVLDMGYLPKQVKQAVDMVLKTKTWKTMTVEDIIDVLTEIAEEGTSDSEAAKTQNEADGTGDHKTQDPEKLKETNETLREQTICKMCCMEKVSIVFLPCGHLVSCGQCSPALRKCPMCRQGIKGTVRVKFN